MKKIIVLVPIILLLYSSPALANQAPSRQSGLGLLLLVLAILLFTMIGGGYGIMRRKQDKAGARTWLAIKALVYLPILFYSLAFEMANIAGGLFFACVAFSRGIKLIGWGNESRTSPPPGYLERANAWRLIPAGFGLILTTIFLFGLIIAFIAYNGNDLEFEPALQNFVAYQMAYTELLKQNPQTANLFKHKNPVRFFSSYLSNYYRRLNFDVIFNYKENKSGFTAYFVPHIPIFPYNLLTSRRSYFADETGKIRMIKVQSRGMLCPPDAPVVMQVQNAEVQRMRAQIDAENEE